MNGFFPGMCCCGNHRKEINNNLKPIFEDDVPFIAMFTLSGRYSFHLQGHNNLYSLFANFYLPSIMKKGKYVEIVKGTQNGVLALPDIIRSEIIDWIIVGHFNDFSKKLENHINDVYNKKDEIDARRIDARRHMLWGFSYPDNIKNNVLLQHIIPINKNALYDQLNNIGTVVNFIYLVAEKGKLLDKTNKDILEIVFSPSTYNWFIYTIESIITGSKGNTKKFSNDLDQLTFFSKFEVTAKKFASNLTTFLKQPNTMVTGDSCNDMLNQFVNDLNKQTN